MRATSLAVLLGSLGAVGCTSLRTVPDVASARAATGVPYYLPVQYNEITTTRSLIQCFAPDEKGRPSNTDHVLFSVQVEAKPLYAAGEGYLIDYRELAGWTKITSLAIETHPNGTLKSINAKAEDRTAKIIEQTGKAAFGIAMLAGGIPIPAAAAGPMSADKPLPVDQMLVCGPETQNLLDAVTLKAAELKRATERLSSVTDEIAELTDLARAGALGDDGKKKLLKLIADQDAAVLSVAAAQISVKKATNAVSSTQFVRWPDEPRTTSGRGSINVADAKKFANLLRRVPAVPGENSSENTCGTNLTVDHVEEIKSCITSKTSISLALAPELKGESGAAQETAKEIGPSKKGVFVRTPVSGRLYICLESLSPVCTPESRHIIFRSEAAAIPQLGRLRFLPFKNEVFQNNSLTLVVRQDGSIEKFEYADLASRGEAAATLAANLVEQAQGFTAARRADGLADEAAKRAAVVASRDETLADIQYDIDLIEQTNARAIQQQTPLVSATAPIEAETRLAEARAGLWRAQLAERLALAALNGN